MGNRKSLGSLISKYAILEIFYSAFVFIFLLLVFNSLISNGFIYPANHAEVNLNKIEELLKRDDFNPTDIPYYYDYKYYENGQDVKSNIDPKYKDYTIEADNKGLAYTNSIINAKYFKKLTYKDKELILAYQVSPILASENLYKKIRNVELLYLLLSFVIWIIGFIYLIKRTQKIIKSEINLIATSNDNIRNMNLDYKRKNSEYTEIQGVLDSLDTMARDLKKSLNDQWQTEKNQKTLIESITHDIRTPITLIKGNTELLKEESNPSQLEYINDLENGIDRLEIYVDKLKKYPTLENNHPQKVNQNTIDYWINIAHSICKSAKINLVVTKSDTSTIKLDKEEIAMAIQNIIVNATEHSPKDSNIYLTFEEYKSYFQIIVKDQGTGFKQEILNQAPKKYLTTKKDKSKHGLGLSMVDELLKTNKGELKLGNYHKDDKSGALIRMIFYK